MRKCVEIIAANEYARIFGICLDHLNTLCRVTLNRWAIGECGAKFLSFVLTCRQLEVKKTCSTGRHVLRHNRVYSSRCSIDNDEVHVHGRFAEDISGTEASELSG